MGFESLEAVDSASIQDQEATTDAHTRAGNTTQPGNVDVGPDVIDSDLAESESVSTRFFVFQSPQVDSYREGCAAG